MDTAGALDPEAAGEGEEPEEDEPEGVALPDELWSHARRTRATNGEKRKARMVGRLGTDFGAQRKLNVVSSGPHTWKNARGALRFRRQRVDPSM